MKRNILTSVAALSVLWFAATGCSEDTVLGGTENGHIALDVDFQSAPITGKKPALSRAEGQVATPITASQLSLALTATDSRDYSETWTSLDEFDSAKDIPTGAYKLEAFYGTSADEGWNKPYYYGSTELRVRNEQTTQVSLPVALANSIVAVKFTDTFTDFMSAYSARIHSAGGGYYDYTGQESDELYILPGQVTIDVTFTKPDGTEATVKAAEFEAKPRYRHTVTIDVNNGEVGKESLVLTFDDTLDEKELTIDISDDILSAPAPELTLVNVAPGAAIDIVETVGTADAPKANIVARGKIGSVTLTTRSEALLAKGWPAEVDLAAPSATDKAKLQELGLNTLGVWTSPDVLGVVDFTKVLASIPYVDGGDNTTEFTLTVTDRANKTCDPVTFSVNVEKLALELLSGAIETAGEMSLQVHYNGGDLGKNVSFYARNGRGQGDSDAVADLLTIASVTPTAANPQIFDVVLKGSFITLDQSLDVFARSGDIKTPDILVKVPSMRIAEDSSNPYAKKAEVTVNFYDAEVAAKSNDVKIELSTDGGNTFSPASATLKAARRSRAIAKSSVYELTGLTPATTYTVRAILDGESTKVASFTTETTAQLSHTGFDTWTSEKKGDYQYLWSTPGWATVNALTTSTYGSGSGWGAGGEAYKATSGTIPANGRSNYSNSYGGFIGTDKKADGHTTGNASLHSDLAHSGSNAALVRTVGYGTGNSAGGGTGNPASGFSTCQKVASGELYLGAYENGSANYSGIEFTSRPASVSFYYKYTSYGSSGDYGDCEVKVFDASGNEIASGIKTLNAQSSYQQETVPVNYPTGATKAAKIMIRFKSSANPGLTNNSTWLYGPGNKNGSGGEYLGSELYIDDIVLNY